MDKEIAVTFKMLKSLRKRVKIHCDKKDISLKDYLTDLILKDLEANEEQ